MQNLVFVVPDTVIVVLQYLLIVQFGAINSYFNHYIYFLFILSCVSLLKGTLNTCSHIYFRRFS